ncbi:MAG: ABC transporter ATP-binding protein [Dehalococcoidales bacterium]|jgi:peptide/nickel transport system ATP-binding protein|nr:ABC transporter ATP-binding protein [Dehalococcoidales bacterium]
MNEFLVLNNITMDFQVRRQLFGSLNVRAVDSVSLKLKQNETIGIVGESGSGKTTLGRLALRLLKPTGGNILFHGQNITRASEASLKSFRRQAQGIFQDPFASIDSFMNIYQILEEPLLIHRIGNQDMRRKLVSQALEEVKLTPVDDFLPKYTHTLSGGQRQRLAIGRALILRPDFILADEPVSMIDASSRAEILFLFKELQERRKISFIYITHDIATAHYFCQRIAVMYLGRIVELGPALTLIRKPLHPYTRALIAAVPSPNPSNRLQERLIIPGESPSPINAPIGCRFHPRCPDIIPNKCNVEQPQTITIRKGHLTACHLYS